MGNTRIRLSNYQTLGTDSFYFYKLLHNVWKKATLIFSKIKIPIRIMQ